MTIRKLLLCVCTAVLYFATASAQVWMDVTETYLANPTLYNGICDGCDVTYDNNGGSSGGPRCSYGAMELWNCSARMSQSLNVPNGRYRLSVDGFFRTQALSTAYQYYSSDMEDITAYVFANSNKVAMKSIFSESRKEQNGTGSRSEANS